MTSSRQTHGAQTLPAEYYLSEAVFARESQRIFDASWLCVGRTAQLAAPGDYFLAEVEGESLIVLRNRGLQLRAFYNVCRHRGTRLCEQAAGSVGQAVVCPYHGWTYDLQGQLLAAPTLREGDDFRLSDFSLQAAAVAEWEGFAFVNLAAAPVPFEQAFQPLTGKFARWQLAELASVRQVVYRLEANWKLIFQNYNECYHCPRVHPHLNALSPYRSATNDLEEGPFLGGPMQLAEGAETMSLDGARCGEAFASLSDADRRRVYYYSLFPTMFVSPHPDYVLVHRVERLAVERTRVVCDLLFHPRAMAQPGFDPTPAVEFWDEVNRQDWRVCELSQAGLRSRAYRPAPYSSLESTVAAFDRHYLERLNDESSIAPHAGKPEA